MTILQKTTETLKSFKKLNRDFAEKVNEAESIKDLNYFFYTRNHITPGNTNKNGDNLPAFKKELIHRYAIRAQKRMEKEIDLINQIYAAELPDLIQINIEWKKNSTWGQNPTAKAKIIKGSLILDHTNSGSVSGCGYDKESAAFAMALNNSLSVQKLLLVNSKKISKIYGVGASAFSSGVGVGCYREVFEVIGYAFDKVASGKTFDAWIIRKK